VYSGSSGLIRTSVRIFMHSCSIPLIKSNQSAIDLKLTKLSVYNSVTCEDSSNQPHIISDYFSGCPDHEIGWPFHRMTVLIIGSSSYLGADSATRKSLHIINMNEGVFTGSRISHLPIWIQDSATRKSLHIINTALIHCFRDLWQRFPSTTTRTKASTTALDFYYSSHSEYC
jgi:hypothetical protein